MAIPKVILKLSKSSLQNSVFLVDTHVYFVSVVSDQKITKNPSLIEVTEADHVLDATNGGRVHGLDPPLLRQPLLLTVIINHLDLLPLELGNDPGSESNIKFSFGHRLNPNMLSLIFTKIQFIKLV